ncbi:hypothetical protein Sjap_012676 [Stephania japonica]|uniref:Bromo domain-containing protein n=1 Tax=Stephania japonica TaxID=461633 RepID=A0AAP0IWJ7_9MAGN
MARTTNEEEEETVWGTWEELLLACAVSRHGTKNWDAVAMEVRARTSAPHFLLTPHNCNQRYHDLHRRFAKPKNHDESDERREVVDDEGVRDDDDDEMPWLEELRRRRVAELKLEVQRSDVSIVSLQLKVKRLKEERELGVRAVEENDDAKPDLEKPRSDEKDERKPKPETASPATGDMNPVASEESGRENQSFNESNSTDRKAVKPDSGSQPPAPVPEKSAGGEPDPLSGESPEDKSVTPAVAAAEGSYNGSSDTVARDSAAAAVEKRSDSAVPTRGGESGELRESVAESKGGEEGVVKENSDVQSSASLSKKTKKSRRQKEVSASSSGDGADEPETEEVSPAIERVSVESEPLIGVLEIIKTHKLGSVFERRLLSQESGQYKSLVRQHLDLRTIEARLKEGWYTSCSAKFRRDLLLLFNNAIVFFPKNSTEFAAATELRDLFSKHIGSVNQLSVQQSEGSTPTPPTVTTAAAPIVVVSVPKPDPELSDSLLAKQKSSGPIIVCRKRSSIAAKATAAASTGEKKVEQRGGGVVGEGKKPVVADRKHLQQQQLDSSNNEKNNDGNGMKSAVVVEEQSVVNRRKRDGTVSGSRSSRPNNKNTNNNINSNNNQTKNSNPSNTQKNSSFNTNMGSTPKGGAAANADDDSLDSKPGEKEKKNNKDSSSNNNNNNNSSNVAAVAKKQSVANFLNRMKRNSSSSNNGTLLETLKSSGSSGKGGGGGAAEQKRSSGRNTETKRQGLAGKQQEQSSPAKRSVGRPPKRTPPTPSSKRTREAATAAEAEAVVAMRQPRKRSRR